MAAMLLLQSDVPRISDQVPRPSKPLLSGALCYSGVSVPDESVFKIQNGRRIKSGVNLKIVKKNLWLSFTENAANKQLNNVTLPGTQVAQAPLGTVKMTLLSLHTALLKEFV